ncbi:MAG: YkoP family protein [Dehalococcoidia bacterium]
MRRTRIIDTLLRAVLRPLLPAIHRLFTVVLGIRSPGRSGGIILIELTRHKGSTIKLADGSEVRHGDRVIKLHLDNVWIAERRQSGLRTGTSALPRGVARCFRDGFKLLAAQVADGSYGNVVAVYGWTVLHSGARRLGFQVFELPGTLRTKLAQLYITSLMRFYSIRGQRRYKASREHLKVKAVWLSRDELLRIYHSC